MSMMPGDRDGENAHPRPSPFGHENFTGEVHQHASSTNFTIGWKAGIACTQIGVSVTGDDHDTS